MPLILALIFAMSFLSCVGVKPYQKEFLVHPLMDDKGLSSLSSIFAPRITGEYEKLSAGSPSTATLTSCPTCGG